MAESSNAEHASVEIRDLNEQVAFSIKKKLCHDSPSFPESCIFKVPATLRRYNENVFGPNMVSIGPFHHGKARLEAMEKIKLWYLHCLLRRFHPRPPEETLKCFAESVGKLQKHARQCYAEPIKDHNDEKFIEMMVVDGCFLIEIFRKKSSSALVHKDDPIFNSPWMRENLYHDFILLENQIPWFVLDHLFELTMSLQKQEIPLLDLVIRFFKDMMLMTPHAQVEYRSREGREIKHILDLLCSCLLFSPPAIIADNARWHRLPPVTDLLRAGIKFKKGNPDNIFRIDFNNGVFEIPPISIRSNSESLFRNLIAYEQYDRDSMLIFTSYAVFLDYLINTSKDVDVLSDEGILEHALSTEDISFIFNGLYNETLVYDFYYAGVSREVYQHYKSRWPIWRTTLIREYFKNPWRISSVVAAILILLFTFTQTIFGALSYF